MPRVANIIKVAVTLFKTTSKNSVKIKIIRKNVLTLFRIGLFGVAHGWSIQIIRYISSTMIKIGTVTR